MFNKFRNLEPGWNGYDAEPITQEYIDKAEKLFNLLPPRFEAFPLATDGIQLEFEDDSTYLEFSVEKDIKAYWYITHGDTKSEGEEIFDNINLAAKFASFIVKNKAERIATELFGEMRDLTPQERKGVNEYMESISKPTGINAFDFTDKKRTDYINWDEYFMGVAILASHRSKDPNTQVGTCIVDENNVIISTGYNGLPIGCSDDEFPWNREGENTKYQYVVHSELNAILNSSGKSLKNSILYVSLFPCNECAKAIIQSGIKEVVYLSDKYDGTKGNVASKLMLKTAGVKLRQMTSDKTLTISYE